MIDTCLEKEVNQMNNYTTILDILIQTLQKKSRYIEGLYTLTKSQEEVLKDAVMDVEKFAELTTQKQIMIDMIKILDDGFEQSYSRVKNVLQQNPKVYATYIEKMQSLIKGIGHTSISIEMLEEKNQKHYITILNMKHTNQQSRENIVGKKSVVKSYAKQKNLK